MAKARLDQKLLRKMAAEVGKEEKYVREQISRRASRLAITSEAAQVLMAMELGLGTARTLRALSAHAQQQVHDLLPSLFEGAPMAPVPKATTRYRPPKKPPNPITLAIEYLISDDVLKKRCGDLLRGAGPHDRVFREATTVLDHRLKKLGGIVGYMNPADVVGKVVSPNPAKAVLVVSDEADVQEGFHAICRGLVLTFRGPAHHELTDNVSREDALRFCGFVDILLGMLADARKGKSAPAGIVKDSASGPGSIQQIPPKEAERLREQDND